MESSFCKVTGLRPASMQKLHSFADVCRDIFTVFKKAPFHNTSELLHLILKQSFLKVCSFLTKKIPFSFSFYFSFLFISSDNIKFTASAIKNKNNNICKMININNDNNKTFLVRR